MTTYAQGWAVPSKSPETPVACTGCPGVDPTLMMVGYKAPIATFTGRFLDSSNTSEWFIPFRTARANFVLVMPALDRIYFRYGNGTVVAYTLSRFFTRLEAGERLVMPLSPPPSSRSGNPEVFLNWDDWFNPELSSWRWFNIDGATRMPGFDVDDKGYVYVASTIYGWGIVRDSLGANGKMQSVIQKFPGPNDATPGRVAVIKGATRYYAVLGSAVQPLWDVTDRANPVQVRATVPLLLSFAKTAAADRIGIIDTFHHLTVYGADALATGGQPFFAASGYQFITSDGTNFYGLTNTENGKAIAVIVPSGLSGYTVQGTYPIGATMDVSNIHYGDGYLVLTGFDGGGGWDLRLFKVGANLVPSQVVINGTPADASYPSYFRNYYGLPPSGYIAPGYINMVDGTVYRAPSGKSYLIVCAQGIGDVYELAGGDSVTTTNDGRAGTVNVNAPATSNLKTFYGDPVQFTAKSSSSNVSTVVWNFGNPEAGLPANSQQTTSNGQSISYQYSNLTKAGLGVKNVTASSINDANIRGTATVTLESPTARFGVAGTKYLFTQPNASSAAPIVVGDSFVDASDGTVESHYAAWTVDGATTNALPAQSLSVGLCGAHSVTFTGFYGPYRTGASLVTSGSNFPVGIDGAVNYGVRPFAASLELVTSDSATITFGSTSRFTNDSSVMTAAQVAGFSYKWELVNSTGAAVATGVTGNTTTIPNFVVSKASLNGLQNARVRLTISTSAPFQAACSGMETSVALSNPISVPDPTITQTGDCQGKPCSFAVSSVSGISPTSDNWTYKWEVIGTGTNIIDPTTVLTGNTLTTTFQKTGTFTVKVTVTNAVGFGIGSLTVIINTAGSVCAKMTQFSFVPKYTGSAGCNANLACSTGETITLWADTPLFGGYDPLCSTHTYSWSLNGIQIASSSPADYVVTATGGTITLTVKNAGGDSFQYTVPLAVGSTGGGGGNPCGTMTAANILPAYSAASCPNGGTCNTNDAITFDVQTYGYNFGCGTHTFSWNFGDGATASAQRASHAFTANGSHAVSLTVSNQYGASVTKNFTVTTSAGLPVTCPTMSTTSIAISFTAPSGCSSNTTNTTCKNGETVSFDVTSFTGYDFNCSNHSYTWNFGDGGSASTKSASHTFSNSGPHAVSVTISNTSQQNFVRYLTVQTSDSTNPNSCGAITPNLTLSINYANGNSTCGPLGGDCAAGEVVNFTVIPYLYDLNCAPHTFDWDFGDGSPHVTTKDTPHQYVAQGTYNVKCIVSNGGAPVTLSQQVSVKGNSPQTTPVVVSYSVAPLQGVANGFLFTPSFDHPELVAKWQWDYGDGQKSSMITGTPRPISWIYADNKTYTVTLTAYDSAGQPFPPATHPGEPKRRSVRH